MRKIKKLYCPYCMNEQNIEFNFEHDEYSGISTGTPHCLKCKKEIMELKKEFLAEYKVFNCSEIKKSEQKYNSYEKIKEKMHQKYGQEQYDEIENIFSVNSKKYEYEYQKEKINDWALIMIEMSAVLFWIFSLFTKNISTIIITTVFIMLVLMGCSILLIRAKLYVKLYNYILNNGKKFSGSVINIYKIEETSETDGVNRVLLSYYFEIEYFNSIKNETIHFFTPQLAHAPEFTKYIECDIYWIENIPKKFRKLKIKPHEIAVNFNSYNN